VNSPVSALAGAPIDAQVGYLVRKARLHLMPPFVELTSGLIVDLGANIGEWTIAILKSMPHARVLAVEPLPEIHRQLVTKSERRIKARHD